MNEAIARLKTVSEHYEAAKTRIVGTKDTQSEFEKSKRLYFPNKSSISYKFYDDLINTHSEALHYKEVVNKFLDI